MYTSGIILVTGATGGVGKKVVNLWQRKGLRVRTLVRNEEKSRRLLGPDVDLITGDVTKASSLIPEHFKGVRAVINTVSVIVGPKEGDTPDRAKYSQGIKFFEPKIKGDSPEMVVFIGMKNLINVVKGTVGLRHGKLVFGFEDNSPSREITWGALDDVVMGEVKVRFKSIQTGVKVVVQREFSVELFPLQTMVVLPVSGREALLSCAAMSCSVRIRPGELKNTLLGIGGDHNPLCE